MSSETNLFNNPSSLQMAAWTLRLTTEDMFKFLFKSDPHLFGLMYATCSGAAEPPSDMRNLSKSSIDGVEDNEKLLATLKDLQRQFGQDATGKFARMYLEGFSVFSVLAKDDEKYTELMAAWAESAAKAAGKVMTAQEENLGRIQRLVGLSDVERDLLFFQLNRHRPGFSQLLSLVMLTDDFTAMIIGIMLDTSAANVKAALAEESKLVTSGLLTVTERPLRIDLPSEHFRSTINELAADDNAFIARFIKPLKSKPSTSSLARIDDRDREILTQLMALPVPEEFGLHALVYGPPSVDKRDMITRLLSEQELDAYGVVTKNVPGSDLPAWTYIAQRHMQETTPEAVLVVDRADQALTSRQMSLAFLFGFDDDESTGEDGKASDTGLTSGRIRCIWMTDRSSFLTEKNLGRFLFHCEARPGSRADRRERIATVISELDLSKELEHHLTKYSFLGETQVRQAAKLATILHTETEPRETVMKRAIHQAQKALGRDKTEELRDSVTAYSLANLNVEGRFQPEHIIKALKNKPAGTLCMYGLPGAGKTQLAEYMAIELDMPILMKKASDLLSKWLGDTEQNIAAMFAEAEAEGAILFLDEADSFLRDRSLARESWGITQVNELLQQMERFDGIFIAATNLMQDVDAAALRRFTFKLEFMPLKAEQALHMFSVETGVAESDITEEMADSLALIANLTPGDFATVKRQANLLGEELSPEAWLDQLAMEAKAKMKGLERNKLGFG